MQIDHKIENRESNLDWTCRVEPGSYQGGGEGAGPGTMLHGPWWAGGGRLPPGDLLRAPKNAVALAHLEKWKIDPRNDLFDFGVETRFSERILE